MSRESGPRRAFRTKRQEPSKAPRDLICAGLKRVRDQKKSGLRSNEGDDFHFLLVAWNVLEKDVFQELVCACFEGASVLSISLGARPNVDR